MINVRRGNGSWALCGEYLEYRKEGGAFSPEAWNDRKKELEKKNTKTNLQRKLDEANRKTYRFLEGEKE